MMERRKALDGPLPRRVVRDRRPLELPADDAFDEVAAGLGQAGGVAPPWPSPACCGTCAATSGFGARVVPIIPDEARTFGMDALFREFKIYAAQGQQLRARRPRPAAVLHRGPGRPDPRGGHHRGGLDGELHRRRHHLRHPGRADGAVLHLLFDVRLPAGRRPHLAGRRRPGPGLPARRHRRAHHAARRGPPAPGRPQPGAGLHGAGRARPTTRPSPTRWRPSSRHGIHRMYGADARGRLLLPDPLQRELPDAGRCPTGPASRTASSQGLYRWRRRARGPEPSGPRSCSPARPRAPPGRPRPSWPSTTTSASSCGRPPRYKALREEALGGRALEPAAPRAEPPRAPLVTELLGDGRGPDRRRHRLHEGRARPGEPVGAPGAVHPARHRRLRPLRHPRGAAPLLRDRRRPRRRGRARRAWPRWAR